MSIATNYGRFKATSKCLFIELCIEVTIQGAAGQVTYSMDKELYTEWHKEAFQGKVQTGQSRAAQISKMHTFRGFGKKFDKHGVDFVRRWYIHRVPNVTFAMLPTELRLRMKRGYI